jgi:hypothetical protein
MVPKSMADWVGADLKKLRKRRSYGVEGRGIVVYEGSLQIRLGPTELTIPCLFSSQEKTPLLLGRAGIFDHFTVLFEGRSKSIQFRPF